MEDKIMKQFINSPDRFLTAGDTDKEAEKTSAVMEERLKIINFFADKKISEKKGKLVIIQSLLDEFELYSVGELDMSIDEADKKFRNLDFSEDGVRKDVFKIEEEIERLETAKAKAIDHYDELAESFERASAFNADDAGADGGFEKFVEQYLAGCVDYDISDNDVKEIIKKRIN